MTRHDLPDDELMTRFSEVLSSEAERHQPSGDSLARIQARVPGSTGRTTWRWAAPLAVAAAVVGIASAVVFLPSDEPVATPLPGTSVIPSPSVSTTASPPAIVTPSPSPPCAVSGPYIPVPRYVVGTFGDRSALYREFFAFAECYTGVTSANGDVEQAVESLGWRQDVRGDADYTSLWPTGTKMAAFSRAGGAASLTLNSSPVSDGDLALQQLVYTVTAADNTITSVTVTTPDGVFADLTRAPQIEVLAPVWLTDALAEEVSGGYRITMNGTASVFEATVSWTISDENGNVVDSGFAMTPESAPARGPWTATSKVLPKDRYYTVTAYESSAEDGSVRWPDTKKAP